ncbi:MAG: hypothetical protein UX85_C0007G0086 [Candidatus Beckwithbacteria bacterium GW2011_GWB1_47_15]|uniref:CarD-like/TRCF RNAP-interacting domain-containing protein n=1 Tax=Candidatus Beckwithbacteria bacterium GW2011_GWB1_47_15 TaxID=1618371 RepID=A0A0G1RU07_9BACT|nr:MAG: hypothetical protein UY43_C0001G0494 [Candidatus Beckwithbacteria bacterium GW2011_GWC1_49_16]KKU35155.1 MAG: hypothetical protein UX50_C0006G0081 [Candidatus Beckwithbacteria bacterium GW2011_GWA1_46_30]KKU60799.1 MAG: hypothetical protein UX85_C0007G0086 [Candidatus Beckwithbacteria bacterium GW2011_GWB1_47_15]KKU71604.1 MAG: hypothetical protein UX97_C0005G0087 [Candidatus Beckwithbacteria bacterium GW2011_GWA2_47_25]KKW03443.1 MAG: hypothetical protein UY37_C0005G0006 [Candidatus Be
MISKLNLTVGDLVVRYGKVLKVFQIKKDAVSLRPFFNSQSSHGLTFTLKQKSVSQGHVRRLVSKTKLKDLLNLIIKKSIAKDRCPAFDSDTALNRNRLTDALWVLKTLWLEKQERSDTLATGKSNIFQRVLLQTAEEIAAVNRTSPERAKLQLLSGLKASLKTNS